MGISCFTGFITEDWRKLVSKLDFFLLKIKKKIGRPIGRD